MNKLKNLKDKPAHQVKKENILPWFLAKGWTLQKNTNDKYNIKYELASPTPTYDIKTAETHAARKIGAQHIYKDSSQYIITLNPDIQTTY